MSLKNEPRGSPKEFPTMGGWEGGGFISTGILAFSLTMCLPKLVPSPAGLIAKISEEVLFGVVNHGHIG